MRRLPEGFRLGAATASYQIEGSVTADGRGPSIWDTFAERPGAVRDGDTGRIACDHYRRYEEDLDLAARIGLQDYRFSIAWPRVVPTGRGDVNPAGLDFYSRLVDAVLARGMRPVVTLYHWDLPQGLQDRGGWTNRDTARHFADYAALTAAALGDRVPVFTTLNEPWCSAFLGHASGEHAPGVTDAATAYLVAHHLLLAHGHGVDAVRANVPAGRQVSITLNTVHTRPAGGGDDDRQAARDAELSQNQIFLEPVLAGGLHPELVERTKAVTDWGFVRDGDLRIIAAPLDFLGVNFYNPHLVAAAPVPGATAWPGVADAWVVPEPPPLTAMGWPVRPETLTDMLLTIDADYPGTTFVITENGAAYPDVVTDAGVVDRERALYLRSHLNAVLDAVDAGVDVRGYFAWSLLDNFEWAWGYSQRFGLIHVDYATQQRRLKHSGELYAEIIRTRAV